MITRYRGAPPVLAPDAGLPDCQAEAGGMMYTLGLETLMLCWREQGHTGDHYDHHDRVYWRADAKEVRGVLVN